MTLFNIFTMAMVFALALLPCAIAIYLSRDHNGDWL